MIRLSPPKRLATRVLVGAAGLAVFALPLAAQNVVQQGWNPKEVLAKETYVKPPEIVERIVTAPRNNVAFTNPSPDKQLLPQDRERRAAVDRGVRQAALSAWRRRDRPQGESRARVDDARQRRPHADRSDERRHAHDRDAEGRARERRDLVARRQVDRLHRELRRRDAHLHRRRGDRKVGADHEDAAARRARDGVRLDRRRQERRGRAASRRSRPAEPKRPPVETGPLVRTSEAGKVLQNRNYASLLRDPYDKELHRLLHDGPTRADRRQDEGREEDRAAGADHRRSTRRPTGSTSASRCRPSRTRIWFRSRTSERSSRCGMPPARCSPKSPSERCSEGTGRNADSTGGQGGGGGRGGAQTDTGKRNLQWNPVGSGLVYLQAEAAPAGQRGGANGGARRSGWRRWWRPVVRVRRARTVCTRGPRRSRASDAKVLYEANGRMTSAEFSAGRQDAVRQRGQRSLRRASGRPEQALRDR